MSKFFDAKRRDSVGQLARDELYRSGAPPVLLDTKIEFYEWMVEQIGSGAPVTYIEFGVAHGDSIVFFSKKFTSPDARFYGFDSFEGLPEAWLHHPQFSWSRKGQAPTVADDRVTFVKGWFQNTIPPFFRNWHRPDGAVLVHYDADLYSSTLFALTMVWPHVDDYYFMMDDFLSDDALALRDFATAYPINLSFLSQAGRDGLGRAVPSWVAGRMKKCDFAPQAPE